MNPIIVDAQVLAQLELEQYIDKQAQELAPEFEIDAEYDASSRLRAMLTRAERSHPPEAQVSSLRDALTPSLVNSDRSPLLCTIFKEEKGTIRLHIMEKLEHCINNVWCRFDS